MAKSFFTYFPTPDFLSMASIGVNVTDDFIRVLEFRKSSHGLVLGQYKEYPVPAGIIEEGEIIKKSDLVHLLEKVKADFGYTFVRVSLPEEKTYVFKTELPHLPPEAIASAIEFKIQENVPLSPAEVVFDYSIVAHTADKIHVSVTVVPQVVVASYTDVFKQAGFIPISYKVESQSVARAIVPNGDMTNALVINFTDKKTGFYIISSGVVQFASTLKLGSGSLTSLIERHFKVSHEKALEIKRTKSFAKNSENNELMYSISNSLSVIKDEVNKVLAYWRSYSGTQEEKSVQKIILCGEDVVLAGIDRYLSINTGLPIEVAHVWTNAFDVRTYIPDLPMVESLNYAAAIGLALGPRKQIHV